MSGLIVFLGDSCGADGLVEVSTTTVIGFLECGDNYNDRYHLGWDYGK